jgi:hypothetical protein
MPTTHTSNNCCEEADAVLSKSRTIQQDTESGKSSWDFVSWKK